MSEGEELSSHEEPVGKKTGSTLRNGASQQYFLKWLLVKSKVITWVSKITWPQPLTLGQSDMIGIRIYSEMETLLILEMNPFVAGSSETLRHQKLGLKGNLWLPITLHIQKTLQIDEVLSSSDCLMLKFSYCSDFPTLCVFTSEI